ERLIIAKGCAVQAIHVGSGLLILLFEKECIRYIKPLGFYAGLIITTLCNLPSPESQTSGVRLTTQKIVIVGADEVLSIVNRLRDGRVGDIVILDRSRCSALRADRSSSGCAAER